ILRTLAGLFATRVSPEQASYVFPGVISKVVNFHSRAKNLPSDALLSVLDILRTLIVKVFSDRSLDISISDVAATPTDLLSLPGLLLREDKETDLEEVPVKVILQNTANKHRTSAWLNATSKQLKISISVFMKNLILSPGSRTRIASNPRLADGVFSFVSEIVRNCFKALFREVIPSTFDILSALFHVLTVGLLDYTQRGFFRKTEAVYLMLGRSDLRLLSKQLHAKTLNLVLTQLPQVLSSASEDKICLCVSALKVHLHVSAALDSALLANPDKLNQLSATILNTLSTNVAQNIIRADIHAKDGAGKKQLLEFLGGQSPLEGSGNTLDEIELPPHIDAKHLSTINKKKNSFVPVPKTSLMKRLDLNLESHETTVQFFGAAYSKTSEKVIQSLAAFLGDHCHANTETIVASLVGNLDFSNETVDALTDRMVALWLANSLYRSPPGAMDSAVNFDIDELLEFDEDSEDERNSPQADEETSYLLLQTAQDVLENTKVVLSNGDFDSRSKEYKACENAYSVALETIGLLASRLSKADFQADVLMDYLYPLFEALTYTPDSPVHVQAKIALSQIVNLHYGGSLERLVGDNADYLIDSLSMNLLVSSGLTPSLPGILLVVIRISGLDLLLLNQLQDILSEIFIVIDSFHGYSSLVENFFHVFQEIVLKVMELYGSQLRDNAKLLLGQTSSPYKPWGLTSREEMLKLIDEANKLVDPFADYDSEKEYFVRKPGVPFGDQMGDSDDEDEEDTPEEPLQDSPEPWPSPVPKNIHTSVQQLFTYGLQLLSHPSIKLRIQILHTLKDAYVIMSSNHKILMPILAQYWPLLLVMSAGASNLSEDTQDTTLLQTEQLIAPTLELMLVIFDEDEKHEKFMSSRFLDMWEFMKKKAPVISKILNSRSSRIEGAMVAKAVSLTIPSLYSRLIIRGITIYERIVPDLIAHEMIRVCYALGIDQSMPLGRDVRNHLWVLSYLT
ncbi:hypothetical protein METBIDRAFT_39818, partial [Metschnikowia bicuspidata var. bicuspidata NRRL YB-4993]